MRFTTTAPDRRTLVKAIAEHTGMEPNYAGPPTFNYTVGTITVDREGCGLPLGIRLRSALRVLAVSRASPSLRFPRRADVGPTCGPNRQGRILPRP